MDNNQQRNQEANTVASHLKGNLLPVSPYF